MKVQQRSKGRAHFMDEQRHGQHSVRHGSVPIDGLVLLDRQCYSIWSVFSWNGGACGTLKEGNFH